MSVASPSSRICLPRRSAGKRGARRCHWFRRSGGSSGLQFNAMAVCSASNGTTTLRCIRYEAMQWGLAVCVRACMCVCVCVCVRVCVRVSLCKPL